MYLDELRTLNLTIKILKMIGSPFINPDIETVEKSELSELYHYAEKNKISLLFLDNYRKKGDLQELESIYKKKNERYLKIDEVMSETSQCLTNAGIEHAIFKTIRPYIAETSDIDVLILKNDEEYSKTLKIFKSTHKLLGYGPESVTFYSSKADIGIDIYRNIAISHVIYLNKKRIANYIIKKTLSNGQQVMTLTPEADLLTIINHSVIKEQMFTLAEYYTFLYHLSVMDNVDTLINLFNETDTAMAAESFLALTSMLHRAAHGKAPSNLTGILKVNLEEAFEARRVYKNNFKMPHKYSGLTVAGELLKKLKDERTKISLAVQLLNMLKPSFTKTIITLTLEHLRRETY